MLTKKSLTAIAREHGVDVGHLSRVWRGERRGSYPLYKALRKAGWPLSWQAVAEEAAAKTTHTRRAK